VLVGDVVRRVVTASLDSDLERPELRQFKGNPLDMVLADRGRYVAAALTVVRAYLAAGCPGELPPLASFGDWSRLVRSPLVWLGRADPVETMEAARAEDPELDDLRRVVAGWLEAVGLDRRCTTGEIKQAAECTVYEKERQAAGGTIDTEPVWTGPGPGLAYPEFHEALMNVAYGGKGIDVRKLGRWLGRQRGRVVDGCKLTSREDAHRKQQLWLLQHVGRAASVAK
jgi:putative DNA primase/helicase